MNTTTQKNDLIFSYSSGNLGQAKSLFTSMYLYLNSAASKKASIFDNLLAKNFEDLDGVKLKKLKSPQWLRSLKVHKKYNYFRIDKFFSKNYIFNFKIIENGGWHFGWIRDVDEIIDKLNSFAHLEFNNSKYKDNKYIYNCIENNINFLNTDEKLKIIKMDLLPEYIKNNKDKFKNNLK